MIAGNRSVVAWVLGVTAAVTLSLASTVLAQTPTFTGVGQLSGGQDSKCYGVSPDGTIVSGQAKNSAGETVAVIYDLTVGSPALIDIGFLDPVTNRESKGRGISVDVNGGIHVCGNSKNSSAKNRAFYWLGNRAGTGTFSEIVPLAGDDKTEANELYVFSPASADIVIVGTSYSSGGTGEAFLCPANETAANDNGLGVLRTNSRGYDVGYRGGTVVVGWSDSTWGCGSTSAEAFHYTSTMYHDQGLDWVCGGEPWQISAGPDGVADTNANADNIQVVPVGTTGLVEPDAIVISAGADERLKDQLNPTPDDVNWPNGHDCDDKSWSVHRGVSGNGRYRVGASSFPEEDCSPLPSCDRADGYPRQAHMRDMHNRDDYPPDNCGGIGFLWPLGFLPGDNMSEALAASNGGGPNRTDPRTGLVVVGWSRQVSFDPFQWANDPKAFVCFIKDQDDPQWGGINDLWFLRHQDAGAGEPGASAASQFKDMKDLKVWLEDEGIDMTGWELQSASSVSDDGQVIAGWGVHNSVEEGFVVTIEPAPPTGACCVQTGWGSGTCSQITEAECTGGTWLGAHVICDSCDFCPDPFADTDDDGDVDQDDFSLFQACFTGTAGSATIECECFDTDNDGNVDEDDWGVFEDCASGPDVPADVLCDG